MSRQEVTRRRTSSNVKSPGDAYGIEQLIDPRFKTDDLHDKQGSSRDVLHRRRGGGSRFF